MIYLYFESSTSSSIKNSLTDKKQENYLLSFLFASIVFWLKAFNEISRIFT